VHPLHRASTVLEHPVAVVCASLILAFPGTQCSAGNSNSPAISQIISLRQFTLGQGERIVIDLDHDVAIRQGCLSNPSRIYFDFTSTRLDPSIKRKSTAGSRRLRRMRFGMRTTKSARLVLDLRKASRFAAFKVVEPSRLIVDLIPGKPSPPAFCTKAMQGRPVKEGDITRIVIDPGHGGHDTGGVGPKGTTEAALALDVTQRLTQLLEQQLGLDVVLTRRRDLPVSLYERGDMTNRAAPDIFLSFHADSGSASNRCGPRAYYLDLTNSPSVLRIAARENATFDRTIFELPSLLTSILEDRHMNESRALARSIVRAFSNLPKATGVLPTRSVMAGGPFAVLLGVNTPGVLVSLGCITNPVEEQILRTPSYQNALAQALYTGIRNFVDGNGNSRAREGRK
jgi:N-acetylmuramoyl-L-alanine amidase